MRVLMSFMGSNFGFFNQLLDPHPSSSGSYFRHKICTDAVILGDLFLRFSGCAVPLFDGNNVGCSQFSVPGSLAFRPPPLRVPVCRVVGKSPEENVAWIHANWIIAFVASTKPIWDRGNRKREGEPMRLEHLAGNLEYAVALRVLCTKPNPAHIACAEGD